MIDTAYALNYNLGLTAARSSQLVVAVQYLARALMYRPASPDGWNLLGLCLYHQGRLAAARSCWENSLKIKPDDRQTTDWLAECRLQEQRQAEVIDQLRTLGEQKQYRKAARLAEQFLEANTATVALLFLTGQLQQLAGWRRKAMFTWRRAHALDQTDPQVIRCMLAEMPFWKRCRIAGYLGRLFSRKGQNGSSEAAKA